ncbi:MAG: hypothetical protein ACJLTB_07645 [Algoriphagus aquaeductus]|uniref:hypothetical protein n=1 Tax=Algoriphagus aquaeductus TaxID=475299 RepID=UPI003879517A
MKKVKLNLKTIWLGGFVFLIPVLCFSQFSPTFQSAGSSGKGNAEITPYYANIGTGYEGERAQVFDNFGFQLGVGISDRTEIRAKYDRFSVHEFEGGMNLLMVGPKFSTESGKFAVFIPIGSNFEKDMDATWMTEPTFIFSPALGEKIHLNLSPGFLIPLSSDAGLDETFLKLNLGLAFQLKGGWIIRPEGGLMYFLQEIGDGHFYNFGLGVSKLLASK